MFDLRLISILGLLTVVVIAGLVLDYLNLMRRPVRMGLGVALIGIITGLYITVQAVLPGDYFYGPVFTRARTDQMLVALTFDDGPYPPYTGEILDILKEYQVPATFFVIGKNAEKYPELVARAAAEGHQIGNHTYDHLDLLKANRATIAREIDRTSKLIYSITGLETRLIRPPHGFRDAVVMEVIAERGQKVVEWSVSSRDWENPGVDQIVSQTIAGVKNGAVILLHDGDGVAQTASRAQTVEGTRQIIRILLAKGYKFVTIGEILAKTEEK